MMWLILASLMLQPVLHEPMDVRMVADAEVTWVVDGNALGTTDAGEALVAPLSAGAHQVVAHGPSGDWTAMVRPDPIGETQFVEAWHADHEAHKSNTDYRPLVPIGLAILGFALLLWPSNKS